LLKFDAHQLASIFIPNGIGERNTVECVLYRTVGAKGEF